MDHITICICTYKRPKLLTCALEAIVKLETDARFTYDTLVIDNDREESARLVVEAASVHARYTVAPEQSFAKARNVALDNSRGTHIAFLDDDEYPEPDWLVRLYSTYAEHGAAAVLGVVKPYYDAAPPAWLEDPGVNPYYHERPLTGAELEVGNTGNSLLDRAEIDRLGLRFSNIFGASGGEDAEFFCRLLEGGGRIVSCREAVVHEYVSEVRTRPSYILRRKMLEGAGAAVRYRVLRKGTAYRVRWFAKALAGFILCPLIAITALPIRRARAYRSAMTWAYFGGYLVEHILPGRVRDRSSLGD